MNLVLTCEHYSNALPQEHSNLFISQPEVAHSHRAYDLGAEPLYHALQPLARHSLHYPYSRLLIEPNRSQHHPKLFSEFTKTLSLEEKGVLLQRYYLPYRNQVAAHCKTVIKQIGTVFHLSIHSFTPVLAGEVRNADIGLLYDPKSPQEKQWTFRFKRALKAGDPALRVRSNYPYLGTADGLTTHLRKELPVGYAGMELEVKNDIISSKLIAQIYTALTQVLAHPPQ